MSVSVSDLKMSLSDLRDFIADAVSDETSSRSIPSDFDGFLDTCVYIIIEIASIMNNAYTSAPDSRDENIATARQSIIEITDSANLSGLDSDSASRLRSAFSIPTTVDKDVLYFKKMEIIVDRLLAIVDDDMKDRLSEYYRGMEDGLFQILLTIVDRDYELDIPMRDRQGREKLHDYGSRIMEMYERTEVMRATAHDE